MTQYTTVKADNGKEICFAVRMKMFVLIQTNFIPIYHQILIEETLLKSTGIKQLDSVGLYDDRTGYIIYILNKDFDEKQLFADLEKNFKDYFKNDH